MCHIPTYDFVVRLDAFQDESEASGRHQLDPLLPLVAGCLAREMGYPVHARGFCPSVVHDIIDMA